MKTIIAGSRDFTNLELVEIAVMQSGFDISVVLSGCARGVDRLGELWAKEHDVPVEHYPADWGIHGKRAGYLRNSLMAQNGEALIAV